MKERARKERVCGGRRRRGRIEEEKDGKEGRRDGRT